MYLDYPLLLTGTIDATKYSDNITKICTEDRFRQYETSIERYIKETPFNKIVFIDNSDFEFDENKYLNMASQYNKEFEFIHGTVCIREVQSYGKSYGDAFLIHEALYKSIILKDCEYFYKITGRLFLMNSDKICKTRSKHKNEFIMYPYMGWCMTYIFKANKKDYIEHLDDVYLDCNEKTLNDIEISFFKRLEKSGIDIGSFERYPYIDGVLGSTLKKYSGNIIERFIRNAMSRLHFFQYGSITSRLLGVIMKIKGMKSYI